MFSVLVFETFPQIFDRWTVALLFIRALGYRDGIFCKYIDVIRTSSRLSYAKLLATYE